jgi:glyoxylase-like metal-dependent hydrolase (beta-lactamase superfamily II)
MPYIGKTVGSIQTNCYIYYDEQTKIAAVVDPGGDADRIIEMIEHEGFDMKYILLTHGHYDHTGAVLDLVGEYPDIGIFAYRTEERLLQDPGMSFASFGAIKPDVLLDDGDEINVGKLTLRVIHTPGHTAGSCCYYDEEYGLLFSGDTLFCKSVGRCDLPTGNQKELVASIKNKLFVLPDDVVVLAGHMGGSTIGHEKINNVYVR